ncbi:hypothetical protein SAMN05444273_102202 [Litoreibacter ascidiaceicola]|uniref:Type IV pilus biogenesis n=1 Tax=Litoreibacter ascidiaceicola TaxID=1486859 RepID=A0A1M4VC27_9RHOB|nr:hypothetical protein [Litoreibacter ascidiaceicola]SHE66463.1 hypothetical protein SAMN05444273_102202 [Litoreibacter ascidiaceicola]
MTETTETPIEALKAATEENTLPMAQLALLGTVETPGETRALLRHGNKQVEIVRAGDVVGGHKIVAIETGAVIFDRNGTADRLEIPERSAQNQQPDAA